MANRKHGLPSLKLDFRLGLPVYRQIFRQVQVLASRGRLAPGDQLPTVRALARQLGVNFNTAARAYRLLDRAGIVSAQQGRGTYVVENPAGRRGANASLHRLTVDYITAARRIGFSETEITAAVARRVGMGTEAPGAGDNGE